MFWKGSGKYVGLVGRWFWFFVRKLCVFFLDFFWDVFKFWFRLVFRVFLFVVVKFFESNKYIVVFVGFFWDEMGSFVGFFSEWLGSIFV